MDTLLAAVAEGVRIFDLGRTYQQGMPQSPNHAAYTHSLQRRHGDMVRADGGSAANDVIVMGTHVGTHIDALSHVSHNGLLFGGAVANEALTGGRFNIHGIETVAPFVAPGVLLDIPALLGLEVCEAGTEITPNHLDAAVARQGITIPAGALIVVRSGWGTHWDDRDRFVGHDCGVPGVSEAGARWLADREPVAVGADTIAFERLAPGQGHALLPAHRVLLVERGVNIIETMALEELAEAAIGHFTAVVAPLKLQGATGSPVRPLAVVSA